MLALPLTLDATENIAGAEQQVQQALRLAEWNPHVQLAAGFLYLRRGDTGKAYPYLISAAGGGADSSKVRNTLRATRFFQDQLAARREMLRRFLLDGQAPEHFFSARTELARSFWEEGDLDNALSSLTASDSSTNLEFALLHYEKKEYRKAAALFTLLLSEETENVDYLYLLGRCQVQTGLYSKAIKTFEAGLRIAPDNPELLRETGMAYFLNADFKQSIDFVGRYVVHDQDNASLYFVLAESHDKLGNPQPAISNYKMFLELDDHSDSSRTVQARARLRLLMSGAP